MFPGSGNGRCGDGDVRFFNAGGRGAGELTNGARFRVSLGGGFYDGSVSYSCGVPDGWQQLEELFLGTFRNNPDTTFPENTD